MKLRGFRWSPVRSTAALGRPLLLLLDYDGTLTPIVEHPSRAVLSPATKRLLARLARRPRVRVAIVSGRSLSDVKRLVGLRGLWYVGNHGLEMQAGRRHYVHPSAQRCRPRLARAVSALRTALRDIPGAWVEDKSLTVSVHWRRVPPSSVRRFRRIMAERLAPLRRRKALGVTRGKRVIELRPPIRWGKGDAVRWLRRCVARPQPWLLYLGDDRTDESAFAAVNRLQGVSVLVGAPARASSARWSLRSPREVATLLERILETRWKTPDRS